MSDRAAPEHGIAGPPAASNRGLAAAGHGWRFGWWPRFVVWMLALSVPGWFLADAYHVGLRVVTEFALGIKLPPQPPETVEVGAVHVLVAYAAMCLASLHSTRARRIIAITVGIPLLFALEALNGIVAIRSEAMAGGLPGWLQSFRDQLLFAPPWLGAPLVWLLLLGRHELRRLRLAGVGRRSQPLR